MPAISERIINDSSDENSDTNTAHKKNPLVGNEFIELSVSSNEFWSKHHVVSYNQLQEFWCGLTQQARKKLMRIDKQTLFEHARKSMYCSRCNGLLLEGFLHIVMYGKSIQQDVSSDNYRIGASKKGGDVCTENGRQDDAYDPSVHPWGGLTTARDGTLTLLDCYLCSKSLSVVQNVFDSARARERERELLYPDACGGDSRGWTSQGTTGYGRGHGTRETCALHTAQLSVETLEDFWSALGEETRHSLMKMKEEDFIERLMYRFDSKRFCRDCRRNVIREFKQLKELKRMRKEPRCSSWFCAADTAFQYEVSHDTVQADWHQTFLDSLGTYHHFEWAIGTGEGKSDILEFENVGLSVRVKVNGLDLSDLNACYITLRAWKKDGRCSELCVKAHALQGQHCVHCRLVVGDGFITITRGESIRRFFEHAEEAEEEEDDDSMDKDGNEFEGECSRPQKHAKSPELAREFLLDAATVIFKEQVEKAFREGTARQNAHIMFVSLALKLLEKRLHVACKEIITLEKQMKLLEEEEKEKREEEVRKQRRERKRTKEREKKLRRKERLREKEKNECVEESSLVIDDSSMKDSTGGDVSNDVGGRDCTSETGEAIPPLSASDIKEDNDDDQQLLLAEEEYIYSNIEENMDGKFGPTRNNTTSFSYDDRYHQHSRRKLRFPQPDWNSRKYDSRNRAVDGFEYIKRTANGDSNNQLTRVAGPKLIGGKCQCPPNNRVGIKYDSHSCSSTHHHNEHHNKPSPESRIARLVRDHPKYTTNKLLESAASDNTPKPYYRGNNKYNTQVESATRDNSGGGRLKSKLIFGNAVKKVWEPLDSQKRYVRSNSDSDITLRSKTPKVVEASESDQLHNDEFSVTGNDQVTTDTISVSINNHVDTANSTKCSSSSAGNGLKNSQKYSKRAASEDGELLTLADSSISTSSNCSSCLSEGDSNNSSPNHLELAFASSDSEESVQNSSEATRETSHCPLESTNKGRNDAAANKIQENGFARTTMVSSDNLPTEAAAPCIENEGSVVSSSSVGAMPQSVLPQMHNNQSIHYPVFHHAPPAMGYYHHHQTPVTWPVDPANGFMSVPPPHSNHYLFANSFGYGLNGNAAARLMQFGALQHLPPPLLNTAAHLPVFQSAVTRINGVGSKEESKFGGGNTVVGELKEAQHNTQKEPKDAENPHNNNNKKMDKGNGNGFSLFHFSGPVALSTGFKADPVALKEGDVSPKKDSIEEYNLFAASNGIKFSFF